MKYLLDSNVFIQAKNGPYSFEIAPGFWKWLESLSIEQSFLTIKEVRNELIEYDDELKDWIASFPLSHFIEEDLTIQSNMRVITNYVVTNSAFKPHHKNDFLAKADPWLIATALTRDYVVVTQEKKAGPNTTKVKIPNVCDYFGVKYIDVFELMKIKKVELNFFDK